MPEDEKREQFKRILLDLAESQNLLCDDSVRGDFYAQFEELYCDDCGTKHFRHFYSDIFEVLCSVRIKQKTVDILGQNVKILYEQYKPSSPNKDISKELRKLYDHVSLDISRMLYSEAGDYRISGEQTVHELQSQVETLTFEIETAHKLQEQMKQKLNSQQREYVTILGIFAAVVITFIGGLTFSTSVLNNIDKVSTVKLILISLTIGLVLVHVIFGLFHYIDKLVNSSFPSRKICALVISSIIIIALMFCVVYFLPYLKQLN